MILIHFIVQNQFFEILNKNLNKPKHKYESIFKQFIGGVFKILAMIQYILKIKL